MLGNISGDRTAATRRDVLKGLGALGAAAGVGSLSTGSATATISDSAVYQYYHTDWTTITNNLAAVADAGYDAVQVPPAQFSRLYEYERQSDAETYDQPLGYQPIDYRDFDSVFGTESEYQAMVEEAHNQGLAVIADAVINHMAAGDDVFDRTVTLADIPQFASEDFHEPCDINYSDPESVEDCWLVGLRDLKHESSYVRGEIRDYVQKYADLGVDGVRWDAAKHVPESFFQNYANQWADNLGLYAVGEVLQGSADYNQQYADTGMDVTDYALYFTMKENVFTSGGDMRALDGAGLVGQSPGRALTFVSNHDSAPPEYERLAYAFILTYEGYPRVYNHRISIGDSEISTLLDIRRNVLGGSATTRYVDSDLYVFERGDGLVAINIGGGSRTVTVDTGFGANTTLGDCTGTGGDVTTDGSGQAQITVPAQGYVVYSPTCSGDSGGGGGGGTDTITLKMTAPTASGESVFFTGSTSSLTSWGGGVEGTNTSGDTWELTIDDPGSFEWKVRRGPSGGSGDVWESGSNHTSSNLSPSFNGWSDGYTGGSAVYSVSNFAAPGSATTGDVITVSADVTNSGNADGTETVEFRVDGSAEQSTDLTLAAGGSTSVAFDYDTSGLSDGSHTVTIATPDDSQSGTVDVSSNLITLQIQAPTTSGESVFFTGSTSALTNWGGGVEGTNTSGDTWELTIEDPGSFEWKVRRGPSGGSGDVWEDGSNHTSSNLAPSFNGWEDDYTGGSGGDTGTTLEIQAPTASGESVYFTGNNSTLTNWRGGVEGTNTSGDTWEVTLDVSGDFEWKVRRGPSGDAGDVWEDGSNHTSSNLAPSFNGWEDGYTG